MVCQMLLLVVELHFSLEDHSEVLYDRSKVAMEIRKMFRVKPVGHLVSLWWWMAELCCSLVSLRVAAEVEDYVRDAKKLFDYVVKLPSRVK